MSEWTGLALVGDSDSGLEGRRSRAEVVADHSRQHVALGLDGGFGAAADIADGEADGYSLTLLV